jgi:hypothetical protein
MKLEATVAPPATMPGGLQAAQEGLYFIDHERSTCRTTEPLIPLLTISESVSGESRGVPLRSLLIGRGCAPSPDTSGPGRPGWAQDRRPI